jgi:hypothetical protein
VSFPTAAALVKWHFGPGKHGMGGLKAIDMSNVGTGARDPFARDDFHGRFAQTSKAMPLEDTPEYRVLRLAYGPPLVEGRPAGSSPPTETGRRMRRRRRAAAAEAASRAAIQETLRGVNPTGAHGYSDAQIARASGQAESTVRRIRCRALREVAERAEPLGLIRRAA